jgi:iron(III) transport system ATP-binding protein
MATVSLRNVSKVFKDAPAVDCISFDVEAGELLVLLGPSGCGKTTTLRLIAGLEEPDAGEISISAKLVSAPEQGVFIPTERRGIGMVFQSYAIWPHMTVFDNVAYPLRVRRTPPEVIRAKVHAALGLVGLEGLGDRGATQLSGGQQQRVALARAMVFEPSILLLDEPLSNLDAKLRVHMRIELKRLLRKTGITAVYVTHDQAESMALADRIIVMNQGHIEQIGSSQEIYERPRTKFVADFVGSINLFPAEFFGGEMEGEFARIRISEGGQELYCPPWDTGKLQKGQQVLVSIRPEKVILHRQRPNGALNVWECRVEAAVYYGDRREYELSTGGQVLKVSTSAGNAFSPGEIVYAVTDPEELTLLDGNH